MESEGSLPCSQEPPTSPYPQPDQSSPYNPIQLTQIAGLPQCWQNGQHCLTCLSITMQGVNYTVSSEMG
jgi:hypothetical protein